MSVRRTTPHEQGSEDETSFIEGGDDAVLRRQRKELAAQKLGSLYPDYKPQFLDYVEVVELRDGTRKVMVRGPLRGKTPLFARDGSINKKLPVSRTSLLELTREAMIREREQSIREAEERIARNEQGADDDGANDDARKEARERIKIDRARLAKLEKEKKRLEQGKPLHESLSELENEQGLPLRERLENEQERLEQGSSLRERLENQQERLEQGSSLRERLKAIFKKYRFTLTAVALAVGATIGVIINALTKGLKSVASGVGNGLKGLGKKLASILPGLIGSIVSFVFRAAGEVVKFVGENAWLLILPLATFMLERRVKRD